LLCTDCESDKDGKSSNEDNTEDCPLFRQEGCEGPKVQEKLTEEYRRNGFFSFLMFGWTKGYSLGFESQSFCESFVIDVYIRYLNYVLVPFAKREQLYFKSSYYIFPIRLLQKFVIGSFDYAKNNLPPAQELLERDFWLIPY
jgi:hypothetical protein